MWGKRGMILTRKIYITRRKISRPTFATLMILMTLICVWRVMETMNIHSSTTLRNTTQQLFSSCYYCEDSFWCVCNWYHLFESVMNVTNLSFFVIPDNV